MRYFSHACICELNSYIDNNEKARDIPADNKNYVVMCGGTTGLRIGKEKFGDWIGIRMVVGYIHGVEFSRIVNCLQHYTAFCGRA